MRLATLAIATGVLLCSTSTDAAAESWVLWDRGPAEDPKQYKTVSVHPTSDACRLAAVEKGRPYGAKPIVTPGTIGVIGMFEQKQNVPASAPPEVQKLLATRTMWYEASC